MNNLKKEMEIFSVEEEKFLNILGSLIECFSKQSTSMREHILVHRSIFLAVVSLLFSLAKFLKEKNKDIYHQLIDVFKTKSKSIISEFNSINLPDNVEMDVNAQEFLILILEMEKYLEGINNSNLDILGNDKIISLLKNFISLLAINSSKIALHINYLLFSAFNKYKRKEEKSHKADDKMKEITFIRLESLYDYSTLNKIEKYKLKIKGEFNYFKKNRNKIFIDLYTWNFIINNINIIDINNRTYYYIYCFPSKLNERFYPLSIMRKQKYFLNEKILVSLEIGTYFNSKVDKIRKEIQKKDLEQEDEKTESIFDTSIGKTWSSLIRTLTFLLTFTVFGISQNWFIFETNLITIGISIVLSWVILLTIYLLPLRIKMTSQEFQNRVDITTIINIVFIMFLLNFTISFNINVDKIIFRNFYVSISGFIMLLMSFFFGFLSLSIFFNFNDKLAIIKIENSFKNRINTIIITLVIFSFIYFSLSTYFVMFLKDISIYLSLSRMCSSIIILYYLSLIIILSILKIKRKNELMLIKDFLLLQ